MFETQRKQKSYSTNSGSRKSMSTSLSSPSFCRCCCCWCCCVWSQWARCEWMTMCHALHKALSQYPYTHCRPAAGGRGRRRSHVHSWWRWRSPAGQTDTHTQGWTELLLPPPQKPLQDPQWHSIFTCTHRTTRWHHLPHYFSDECRRSLTTSQYLIDATSYLLCIRATNTIFYPCNYKYKPSHFSLLLIIFVKLLRGIKIVFLIFQNFWNVASMLSGGLVGR